MHETTVELTTDSVPLSGLLKLVCFVGSGGEATQLVQAADVRVSGALETRRGAKVRAGDVVGIEGEELVRIRIPSAELA